MMQGDGYYIAVELRNNAGVPITPGDVLEVELTLVNLRKSYREGQVKFADGRWHFPLGQRESLALPAARALEFQVRVQWANNAVEGAVIPGIRFDQSLSREVLG